MRYTGLFARSGGTIKNLIITDSYINGGSYTATFVGTGNISSVILNCGSTATIDGGYNKGGLAGITSGEVENCYFAGKVFGANGVAIAKGNSNLTITNCYYLNTCGRICLKSTEKTAEQFASGEVCYLLNGSVSGGTTWYQNVDVGTADAYPVLNNSHKMVYTKTDGYTNKTELLGDVDGNNIVDNKDAALMLKYVSGIVTATELYMDVADVNSDGNKDMLDVVGILNI